MAAVNSEWRRGMPTLCSSLVGMITLAAASSVLGVVLAPIMAETGWPRSVILAQAFIQSFFTLVLAPVAGRIVARIGLRRYAIVSVTAIVPSLLLVPLAGGEAWTWYAVWIVFGVIQVGIGPMIWSMAITTLFDKARGVALAIALSGGGIAFLVFPPVAVAVEAGYGWRGVYVMLALLFLVIQLPMTLLLFMRPRHLSSVPVEAGSSPGSASSAAVGHSLAQALRGRQFWQLGLACMLVALVEGAMIIHLFPIMNEAGLAKAEAAGVASLMGFAMIIGRLGAGVLLDRIPATLVFAGAMGLILLAVLLAMRFDGSRGPAAIIALLLGLGAGGTTNTLAYLTGRHFGLGSYATIFGLLMGMFGLAFGSAPTIAGHVRDKFGGYDPLFAVFAAALGASILLILTLGRARPPTPDMAA